MWRTHFQSVYVGLKPDVFFISPLRALSIPLFTTPVISNESNYSLRRNTASLSGDGGFHCPTLIMSLAPFQGPGCWNNPSLILELLHCSIVIIWVTCRGKHFVLQTIKSPQSQESLSNTLLISFSCSKLIISSLSTNEIKKVFLVY